jgi:hypothetical protein
VSFDTIQSSDSPQLVIGRVLTTGNPLTSPVKEKPCPFLSSSPFFSSHILFPGVYYNSVVSEKVENDWRFRFSEMMWKDFILYDPRFPHAQVFVPTHNVNITVRGINDGAATSGAGAVSFFQSETLPDGISKLLERHNFKVEVDLFFGKSKKEMRYIEESFGIGEVVACLGIVKDGMTPDGRPIKILTPMKGDCLSELYLNQHAWTGTEKQIWNELVGTKACLIASDDPALFQGVKIPIANASQVAPMSPIPPPIQQIPLQQQIFYPAPQQMLLQQQPIQQPMEMVMYPSPQYQQPPPQQQLQFQQQPQSYANYPNPYAPAPGAPHQVYPAPVSAVYPQQQNYQQLPQQQQQQQASLQYGIPQQNYQQQNYQQSPRAAPPPYSPY